MTGIKPYFCAPAFAHSAGPRTAQIALVGEAFGEQEALVGKPFIGNSGQELSRLLNEAGIKRSECFLTNTIAARPASGRVASNNFDLFCGPKAAVGSAYSYPPISSGKYLLPQYLPELDRLKVELEEVRPNLVIALGAKALWALCRTATISSLRGTVMHSTLVPGLKVLPTYHPSYLFKVWSHRPIVLADLMKARREAQFPEIRRPSRSVIVNPTIDEISEWVHDTLAAPPSLLSTDVETSHGQITMVGFARSRSDAIVVPFCDGRTGVNYWNSTLTEVRARQLCNLLLGSRIPKLTQNGLYDIQYFLREKFTLRNFTEDTMLLHHSMFPEMKKGLGFLGSIYTSEPAWKLMRKHQEELKRDE